MSGYIFCHEGKQFSPDGEISVPDVQAHNRELESRELAE